MSNSIELETIDSSQSYTKSEVKIETITPETIQLPNYDYGAKEETLDYNIAIRNKPDMSSYISDTAYGAGWDGITTIAPSKNAVYDKINSIDTTIAAIPDPFLLMGA